MNQCFCRSFAAAVVMSAISSPVAATAETVSQLEGSLSSNEGVSEAFEPSDVAEPAITAEPAIAPSVAVSFAKPVKSRPVTSLSIESLRSEASAQQPIQPSEPETFPQQSLEFETSSQQSLELETSVTPTLGTSVTPTAVALQDESSTTNQFELVRVIPHALDENQAATLYVSNIPVLTFIGSELEAIAAKSIQEADTAADSIRSDSAADPAERASAAALRLEQFYATEGNPESILVRWDADLEEYAIDVADETFVRINEAAILPDTTNDFAEDALQVTNRLRRLLGNAEPLTEIEGQPELVAAGSESWNVTSVFTGQASWYGPGFHGRRTASGEVFNQEALTAAHRTLPFGTQVLVTNLSNDAQVIVRINDRGPFTGGRILDLSAAAAREIGLYSAGVGQIRLEVLPD
ncbi:MAG: septal ring lytic transglycosylase RlpA family protein [Leptolyngbyaceae cyanobacterium]